MRCSGEVFYAEERASGEVLIIIGIQSILDSSFWENQDHDFFFFF